MQETEAQQSRASFRSLLPQLQSQADVKSEVKQIRAKSQAEASMLLPSGQVCGLHLKLQA